jgi:hypothetical protein
MVGLPEWSQVNEQPTGSVSQGNWERWRESKMK